ncbi:MAG: gliding motility-associated ABC transporter substrate-binding protein GldG [Flavobacteriaceae bacterium]
MSVIKHPLLILVCTLILMFLGERIGLRVDLSTDQRYSLSETTQNQLKRLEAPLRIDLFLDGDLPGLYRDYRRELDLFLKQLEFYSDELIIQYNNPFEVGNDEEVIKEMLQYGMGPEIVIENKEGQRKEQLVFPWMIINYGNSSQLISLLDKQLGDTDQDKISRSLQEIEYLISDGIYKVTLKEKSKIAVLTSHQTSESLKLADLLQSLQPYYSINTVDLQNRTFTYKKHLDNLNRFKALLISNPNTPFSQEEKYILDQYSLQGGPILWLLNGVGINRDSLFNTSGKSYGLPLELNLDDYFFYQGVRINKSLIRDLYCAPIVLASGSENNTQYLPYPWPYYPLQKPEPSLIGDKIGPIWMQFSSALDTLTSDLDKTILLQSSEYTATTGIPAVISLEQASEKIKPNTYNEPSKIIGLLLKGESNSLFKNRIKPFQNEAHLDQGELKMIVFGDGNMGENQVDKGAPLQLGYDKWTNNFYDNKKLLVNAIHYLTGNLDGLSTRQKEWKLAYIDIQKIKAKSLSIKLLMLLLPLLFTLGLGWFYQRGRSKQ